MTVKPIVKFGHLTYALTHSGTDVSLRLPAVPAVQPKRILDTMAKIKKSPRNRKLDNFLLSVQRLSGSS